MTASAKATRLLAECRVEPKGAAAVYHVHGDHGQYVVVLGEDFQTCTCPAPGACTHLEASILLHDALQADRSARHVARAVA